MFPVGVVKDPVELKPLRNQLGQLVLPSPVAHPHVAPPVLSVLPHLLVHGGMSLDDDVQTGLVGLQRLVDDAQPESDVEHPFALGSVAGEDAGVGVHEGSFPFHHDGVVVVVVEEQRVGGVVANVACWR